MRQYHENESLSFYEIKINLTNVQLEKEMYKLKALAMAQFRKENMFFTE